jgi:hypothetical protein
MIQVVHRGSGSQILIFYLSRIPDPKVKKAPDRILDPDPQPCLQVYYLSVVGIRYGTLYFTHIYVAGVRFPLYDFWWKRNAANFISAHTNH